jgi:hypothetical protein
VTICDTGSSNPPFRPAIMVRSGLPICATPHLRAGGLAPAQAYSNWNTKEKRMQPIPYEIREEDVDEVLSAYEGVGSQLDDEARAEARRHVMRNVMDLNETVHTAPEDRRVQSRVDAEDEDRARPVTKGPGELPSSRREMALAAIEDLLIRDGYIEGGADEERIFPVVPRD